MNLREPSGVSRDPPSTILSILRKRALRVLAEGIARKGLAATIAASSKRCRDAADALLLKDFFFFYICYYCLWCFFLKIYMYIRIRKPICFFWWLWYAEAGLPPSISRSVAAAKVLNMIWMFPHWQEESRQSACESPCQGKGLLVSWYWLSVSVSPCLPAIVLVLPADVDHGWKVDAACQSASLDETAASDADAGN